MLPAFIFSAAHTPFGRFNGALADTRSYDLAATALRGVLAEAPHLDPAEVGDIVWGLANGAGEDNRNVGRMAVLLAGLPTSAPATTVNRLCGSSLDAVIAASRTVETADAGGVESMTRAPWAPPKPSRSFPLGDVTVVSTTLSWRLVNPRMPTEWSVSLGGCNAQLQERFSISRNEQDAFDARSHVRADAAWAEGLYDDLVVAVGGVNPVRDEAIRPNTTVEVLSDPEPVFRPDGTFTAGNASPLNDGTSAVLIGSETVAGRIGRDPVVPDRRACSISARPAAVRLRPRRGRERGIETRGYLAGRRRRGRTQRGLRRPVAGLRPRMGRRSRDRQPHGQRDHDRPPTGGVRWPHPRDTRQGLAVVLENVTNSEDDA